MPFHCNYLINFFWLPAALALMSLQNNNKWFYAIKCHSVSVTTLSLHQKNCKNNSLFYFTVIMNTLSSLCHCLQQLSLFLPCLWEWLLNIVMSRPMSVCVCLSARISREPHARSLPIFCGCCLWLWLSPASASLRYIMYFWFLWMTSCFVFYNGPYSRNFDYIFQNYSKTKVKGWTEKFDD